MENLSLLPSASLPHGSPARLPRQASFTTSSSVPDDGRTCPICFALMKPPHSAPIILTPCGHTFCAKCIAVHTAVQRKKARLEGAPVGAPPCPECKERIVAQSVNVTLQNIITERLAIEESLRRVEVESRYPATPVRGHLLYEELSAPRKSSHLTRASSARAEFGTHGSASPGPLCCQSLQHALRETRDRRDRLETDLTSEEAKLHLLDAREQELKRTLQKATAEHRLVQSEAEGTKSKAGLLRRAHADTVRKLQLIEAAMVATAFGEVGSIQFRTTSPT